MQIILLSGGSGRRLWPLTNEARSKQFISLLDDGSGIRESMLQRTYRQIRNALGSVAVTIATTEEQCSVIRE